MNNTAWILGIVVVFLFVVIMKAPNPTDTKLATAIGTGAAIITSISLYIAWTEFSKSTARDTTRANELSLTNIQNGFITNKKEIRTLDGLYNEVYQTQKLGVSLDEHAMITLMAQSIEDVDYVYKFSDLSLCEFPTDNGFINLFLAWVHTPTFKKVWPTIASYYDIKSIDLVNKLIRLSDVRLPKAQNNGPTVQTPRSRN